jgi:probable F420-dependent oxidoreductase
MVEVMGRRFPEGISACAVLMGATERIHMLTYVLVVPYRNPVLLAKQIATMEFIAGGRFTLGAAPGHLQREFEVLDIPFEDRGWITDEYIKAMIECWTSDSPRFHGKYVSFTDIVMEPKPVQKPYPPIFIGGNTEIAMKRAVRLGDGWIPWLITTDRLRECVAFMKEQPGWEEKADRFEIVMPTTEYKVEDFSHAEMGHTVIEMDRDKILFELEALQQAGTTVAQVMTPPVQVVDECLEWVEWYDTDIIPNFR